MSDQVQIRLRADARPRPTELALTLACLPGPYGARDGWVSADEVRARLRLLGFTVSAQQVAAWLRRMADSVDTPPVERRQHPHFRPGWEYRVTSPSRTDVENRLRSVRLQTPWLPTMRGTT